MRDRESSAFYRIKFDDFTQRYKSALICCLRHRAHHTSDPDVQTDKASCKTS